jgi:hypothetical protein
MLYRSSIIIYINQLSNQRRARVIGALIEGNSICSAVRMTGVCKDAVLKLIRHMGLPARSSILSRAWSRVQRVQCDAGLHRTLRVTPAMEAGLADHVWPITELIHVLELATEKAAA